MLTPHTVLSRPSHPRTKKLIWNTRIVGRVKDQTETERASERESERERERASERERERERDRERDRARRGERDRRDRQIDR